ncbi:MAG: glucosamine kinase [Arenicella sp.]|jgi:glucosamine kinase
MTLNKATKTDTHTPDLFIGIDGGGSSCRAKLLSSDGAITGCGFSGRANPVHGVEKTIESIIDCSQKAIKDTGLEPSAIRNITAGIGLAGVNLPSLYEKINHWQHPFKRMFLTTDLHIACLGAHAKQDGSVIIAGTGSCGISIVGSKIFSYGAHGFPWGDQCSGAWLGLQAISVSLLAYDDLGPQTSLCDRVCDALDTNPREIADKMSNQPSKEFAKLARLVFEEAKNGDAVAISVLEDGVGYLNKMARKIMDTSPGRLSLIGGLRSELRPWLASDVQDHLVDPIESPEDGAIYFAKSKASQKTSVVQIQT